MPNNVDDDGAAPLHPPGRRVAGIPLRAVVPNAITALALCFGLSGLRFGLSGEWQLALGSIVFAGVLDAVDGRVARLLRAQTRFGAELDSLSDVIAFGVAPATIIYLWSLAHAPKFGWTAALSLTVCCALRLARFNARIDAEHQPHKAAGYNTGVPAPAGAGLALVPLYLWFVTGEALFRQWWLVMPWVVIVAMLMISSFATYGWQSMTRLRASWRLPMIAFTGLMGAALITAPWHSLLVISALYALSIPLSVLSYRRHRRG